MAKKPYTVLIVSQKADIVKRFILSPLTLKVAAVIFCIVAIISGFILYDYVIYKKKFSELQSLRAETQAQMVEIQSFIDKIAVLEEQLAKLKEMEKKMEKDLSDIQELKKTKKGPQPTVPSRKNMSYSIKESTASRGAVFVREDVSLLENERPRLVRRLHQDLTELRREAFGRERTLDDLGYRLETQKSILVATPSLWPVMGHVTSKFGDTRISESSGGARPHNGLDISALVGTPIHVPADGVVMVSGKEPFYGLLVGVDHGHGFTTFYGHLKDSEVKVGDRVKKGRVIGTVGMTGKTTGPHLHYEVRIHNQPINPIHYLNEAS